MQFSGNEVFIFDKRANEHTDLFRRLEPVEQSQLQLQLSNHNQQIPSPSRFKGDNRCKMIEGPVLRATRCRDARSSAGLRRGLWVMSCL